MTDQGETAKPLICLSAAGGGHFRQLLDIEPLWSRYPHFLVTEDTVLTQALSTREVIEHVPHFALGQMRIGRGVAMISAAVRSAWKSFRIIAKHRPQIIISTGSGSQFFVLLWGRLFGARIVLIDSFARFHAPSKFARIAGPLAHLRIAQSKDSADHWPGSVTFDPLQTEPATATDKENLLLATVGATLPFRRLETAIVNLKRRGQIPEDVILQVGRSKEQHEPVAGLTIVESIPFGELKGLLARANLVVCHGGTGSIITALANCCGVVTMPRLVDKGDCYDNHQSEIAGVFAQRGLVQLANDEQTLLDALQRARAMTRYRVSMDHTRLMAFLEERFRIWFPRSFPGHPQAIENSPAKPENAAKLLSGIS